MERSGRTGGMALPVMFAMTVAWALSAVTLVGTSRAQPSAPEYEQAGDPGLLAWPPNLQNPCATGDWNGGRTWLENRGLTLGLHYYGEVSWNTRGGIRTTDEAVYAGRLDVSVQFSTEAAGLWKDGILFFQFQHKHGNGISEEYVGDFQVLSNMDALNFTQVSELWFGQSFLDDRIWIKVGKQEGNHDFAGVEYGVEFVNSSAGFSPTIPLPSYPDQDLGVVLGTAPIPWFSVKLGVYSGDPDGRRSLKGAFLDLSGPMIIGEPALHYGVGGRRGHFRIGGWFNGKDAESPDEEVPDPESFSEAYGWYLTWNQDLWREHPEDVEDRQGTGIFGQYGWAPPDRSLAEHYVGGGIQWLGMIPRRDEDIAGVGVFHVRFSDEASLEKGSETIIETFYRVQCFGFLFLKPDLQYVINPGGSSNPDAIAVGVRFEVSL